MIRAQKPKRATTLSSQTTGQRAGSVHLVEKLCSFFLLDIQNHSWRASGQEGPRGIGSGCEAHSARTRHNTTCIKQGYKTSAKPNSPWSPSQEGARGQGSSACRGTPSRAEARALHHQPVPALTLTMPCLSCSRSTSDGHQVPLENDGAQLSEFNFRFPKIQSLSFNQNAFKPQIAAIKDKYYEMLRNKTKS